MNLLRSIFSLYDEVFKNESSNPIFINLNSKEQLAVRIIKDNPTLNDSALKHKL